MKEDERIKRLPKWAQQLISRLQDNMERTQKKADEVIGVSESPSNVCIMDCGEPKSLPYDARIRFTLGEGREIDVHHDYDGLVIRVTGGRRMIVKPEVSNVILVQVEEWKEDKL